MNSPTSRRRASGLIAASTGLGILFSGMGGGAAVAAEPFPDADIVREYPSNVSYPYESIMDSFNVLRNDTAIVAQNDATTVTINRSASPEQVDRAIVDQYADMSVSIADGLGSNLGAIYTAGRADGELPKVQALLAKSGGLIGYHSSSNPSKEYFSYDRPYIRFADELIYRDKRGGDAWDSTSGAFPSGHTSQAYWQGTALAVMLPELAPQIMARTSEAGHNRVVMAAHYPLDVMSGRMMGNHIVERRLTDAEFRPLIEAAAAELREFLEVECGNALDVCIASDTPYLSDEASLSIYEDRMTYGFPQVGAAGQPVTVPANAESLLLTSHPQLTGDQRRQVLALTAIDSGYPLDGENTVAGWQRLNVAAAMAAEVVVNADGSVSLAIDAAPVPVPDPTVPTDPGTSPADPGATPGDPAVTPGEPSIPEESNEVATPVADQNRSADGLANTGAQSPFAGVLAAVLALFAGAGLLVGRHRAALK